MAPRLKSSKKKCHFQECWLTDPNFSSWVEKHTSTFMAHCKLCHVNIDLSNMGRTALRSHCEKNNKHKSIVAELKHKETRKHSIFKLSSSSQPQTSNNDSEAQSVSAGQSSSNVKSTTNSQCTSTSQFTSDVGNDSQCASTSQFTSDLRNNSQCVFTSPSLSLSRNASSEIIACLHNVMYHTSLRATESFVSLCPKMFPDSNIAASLKLHKDKISYSINHGLAPFFRNELKEELHKCQHVAFAFDECLNKIAQKNQMDLSVRFWCPVNFVTTRYYNSAFLGSMKAADLLDNFKIAIKPIDPKKIIQIGMDGPNVNLKMLKDLKTDLIAAYDECPKILEIGSCGLHTTNNSFKEGIKQTGWDLNRFFECSFYLFNNYPSRKAEFTKITDCERFPLKSCQTRWIENDAVAQRSLEILPNLKKFVVHVEKEKIAPLKSENFQTMKKFLADPLLPAKLSFFSWLASELEPFLTAFQTDASYVPFLYTSLTNLLSTLLKCFVKEDILVNNTDVTKIDLMDTSNFLFAKNVDLALRVKTTLKKIPQKEYKENDLLIFRRDIRKCLQILCLKLLEKSPLKFKLTKALSSLDPIVAAKINVGKVRFENLMTALIESDQISAKTGETALKQYKQLQLSGRVCEKLNKYSKREVRVDVFWMNIVKIVDFETKEFESIVQMCLIIFHGNAFAERSFSINKSVLDCNLFAESLVARRIVYDKVSTVGGIDNVVITKPLISSFKLAYSRFKVATRVHDVEVKEVENEKLKRKNAIKRIEVLKKQKVDLLTEKTALEDEINDEIRKLEQFVETK